MGSFFAIFCRRLVPDSILPVLFCKAAPHTTFSRSKKRTQIYCMVYILSTCDTLRLDASLPGTFHEDSSNIFSRLSFIISFLFFGLVFGTMREVNSLEQLVVVLEYVQLTRQSGESGLEPDVDCEDQQTTRVATQWLPPSGERLTAYSSRLLVVHDIVEKGCPEKQQILFPTTFKDSQSSIFLPLVLLPSSTFSLLHAPTPPNPPTPPPLTPQPRPLIHQNRSNRTFV